MLFHQLIGDDLPALEVAAASAVSRCDLVVVTGGTSGGARDRAKAMFAALGLETLFSKVAIKPGKPVWRGRVGDTLVMRLPGNPVSANDRETFIRARLFDGQLFSLANQDSGAQRAVAESIWLIRCPARQEPLETGTFVRTLALSGGHFTRRREAAKGIVIPGLTRDPFPVDRPGDGFPRSRE